MQVFNVHAASMPAAVRHQAVLVGYPRCQATVTGGRAGLADDSDASEMEVRVGCGRFDLRVAGSGFVLGVVGVSCEPYSELSKVTWGDDQRRSRGAFCGWLIHKRSWLVYSSEW